MNYIVVDLEATCWDSQSSRNGRVQEIIEIGALKFNAHGDLDSRFESFVRPTHHPNLSDFCKQLTSISQVDVNQADSFPVVIEDFWEWIGLSNDEEYLLCSWGFFDRKAFAKNCLLHDLDDSWTKHHISLKHQYPRIRGIARAIGLRKALDREDFDFEGEHHRGIDDAINTSKIFLKFMHLWHY